MEQLTIPTLLPINKNIIIVNILLWNGAPRWILRKKEKVVLIWKNWHCVLHNPSIVCLNVKMFVYLFIYLLSYYCILSKTGNGIILIWFYINIRVHSNKEKMYTYTPSLKKQNKKVPTYYTYVYEYSYSYIL